MNASFYALFRRGKYGSLRPGLVGDLHKLPHQERERFVAAALGFTIRHSKGFRFWFLKNVLMLPPRFCATNSPDIAISMDEKQSEDLKLERRTEPLFLSVIETKTGAPLQTHQDMRSPECWKTGYLSELKNASKGGRYARVQYCILDLYEQPTRNRRSGVECLGVNWHDVAKRAPQNDSLVIDFMELLISIGLPISTANNPHQMKTNTLPLSNLCRIHHELRTIAAEYQFKLLKQEQIGEIDNPYFGSKFRIPKIKGLSKTLTGWFGWHIIEDKLKCALWFYCSPSQGMGSRVFDRLRKAGLEPMKEADGSSIRISRVPKTLKDDARWLTSIFDRLGLKG